MARKVSEVPNLETDFNEVVDELPGVESNVYQNDDHLVPKIEVNVADSIPDRTSPEWTDYVLSHLTSKEKYNDLPKVAGLRRLVEKFIGKIIYMKPTELVFRELESFTTNQKHFTVICAVCTETIKVKEHGTGEILEFAGIGDASPYNTETTFAKFLERISETRAKGRAFINALAIQCNALEEMVDKPALSQDAIFVDKITDAQLNVMDNIGRKFKINISKFIASYKDEFGFNRIRDITKEQASEMIKRLNGHQQGRENLADKFSGYVSSWKPQEND